MQDEYNFQAIQPSCTFFSETFTSKPQALVSFCEFKLTDAFLHSPCTAGTLGESPLPRHWLIPSQNHPQKTASHLSCNNQAKPPTTPKTQKPPQKKSLRLCLRAAFLRYAGNVPLWGSINTLNKTFPPGNHRNQGDEWGPYSPFTS